MGQRQRLRSTGAYPVRPIGKKRRRSLTAVLIEGTNGTAVVFDCFQRPARGRLRARSTLHASVRRKKPGLGQVLAADAS
jgi:hypothetical protein